MINRIFEFALKQRALVLTSTLALIVIGGWSATKLPIDAVPDITNVQVQVNTSVMALAPEEIEKLVSYPIEMEMGGIENLLEVRSLSKFGLSQVTLIFKEGADIYRSRQLVGERLQKVAPNLPEGAIPEMAPITTGLGEIYHYALKYKDGYGGASEDPVERLRELKLAQDFIIKPVLRTVAGVTEVNTSGGYERQFVIMPNSAKLNSLGVTINDVADAVSRNVSNAGGSSVEKGGEMVSIRAIGRVHSIDDIANLPLGFSGLRSEPLRIKDVAEIAVSSSIRAGTATHNGEEAVLGSVLMLIGENSRIVSGNVHEKILELQSKLPDGMEIQTLYNRTDLVNSTIGTVEKNLFEGAALVIAILMLLLGNWRAALIVASAIPLSMLFAITGMVRYGISGNLMSLGAIDFGLIVDGAVVMAENIVRKTGIKQRELGRLLTKEERIATVLSASRQVGAPTVFGVTIITIVYLPIFALTGTEGKTFTPMAFTVVFALMGALIVALTLVPVLCSFLLISKVSERENLFIRFAKRIYKPVLIFGIKFWWAVSALALGVFALAIWIFSTLGSEFMPQLDEGAMAAQMVRTTSVGLDPSIQIQTEAEKLILEKFPEVADIFTRIGTSEVATDPMGVNVSDSYIMLKPVNQWRKINGKTIGKEALADMMSKELSVNFPAQSYLFSQPIELRFNELLSGTRADIAIKIFGDDYEVLEKVGGEIREIVEKIPGAADVEFDAVGKAPILQVVTDRNAMSRYNIHAGEINDVIKTAFAGTEGGAIVDGNRRYPIVTRLSERERKDFENISNLAVRTNDGGLMAIGKVANVEATESVNTITREAFQRRLALQVNLRGRDVQSFIGEAQRKISQSVVLPEGYFIEYGGAFKNLLEAKERLAVVVPIALGLIFLLLFLAFGNIRQVLIVYSGIPLAITGGIFALYLRGLPFSISAAVGFIALSGVAVLNGLMIISFINQLVKKGKPLMGAVLEGSLTRLRPVLMTALVASLGFAPMALARGTGAEVQRPIATVVIGGIITTTFLTLVLLPALYCRFEKRAKK